jgi:hypothetical protein
MAHVLSRGRNRTGRASPTKDPPVRRHILHAKRGKAERRWRTGSSWFVTSDRSATGTAAVLVNAGNTTTAPGPLPARRAE